MSAIATFAAHPSAVRSITGPRDTQEAAQGKDKAREVSRQFESIFLMQVLENMSSGLGTDPMFGGGAGDEIYRSMFNEQTAGAIANRGGVGIADSVYRSILQMQEARK